MTSGIFKNIKEIFIKLQPTLPYFVTVGIFTGAELSYVLLIPIILELLEWLYTTIKLRFNRYRLQIINFNDRYQPNNFYKIITFLLEYHNLLASANRLYVDTVISNSNQKYNIGSVTLPFDNPLIELDSGVQITFTQPKFTVQIELVEFTKNERKFRKYVIYAQKQSDLDAFITYAKNLQLQYAQKMHHQTRDPMVYSFSKNEFRDNPINVKKTFHNIFLDKLIKSQLKAQLDAFVNGKQRYDELGIAYRIGYLFYGTPGNGKSSLIFAMAHEYHRDLPKEEFVNQIKNIKPNSIIVFEDIDTCPITACRKKETEKTEKNEIVGITLGDLLEVLDGYCYLNGCIIVMTTNHINNLDPALIHSGRIDHKIELTNASNEQIEEMVQYFLRKSLNNR
jgi:ATP-dependent Zn protease